MAKQTGKGEILCDKPEGRNQVSYSMSPASITMPSIQQALDISLLIEGINKPINESEERKYIQKRKRGFSEEDS